LRLSTEIAVYLRNGTRYAKVAVEC